MSALKRMRPKHRPQGGTHVSPDLSLNATALRYLAGLFNTDEALEYLISEVTALASPVKGRTGGARRRWLRAHWSLIHWPRDWIVGVRRGVGYVILPPDPPEELIGDELPRAVALR